MLAALVVSALLTDSALGPLASRWLAKVGFAPRDLWAGRFERLLLSALVTHGGWVFWRVLVMVLVFVGSAERLTGSARTALFFWGGHLVVLLLLSTYAPTYLERHDLTQLPRDVGPSAGAFACLGLAIAHLPAPWPWRLVPLVLVLTVAALFLPPLTSVPSAVDFFADLAHLLAFGLGWGVARIFGTSTRRSQT